jgi:hypothetical protein
LTATEAGTVRDEWGADNVETVLPTIPNVSAVEGTTVTADPADTYLIPIPEYIVHPAYRDW